MTALLLPSNTVDAAGNFLIGGRYVPRVLGASAATGMSAGADTTEDTLATVTVPAGAMGLNGILRVTSYWTVTASTNLKTPRIRFSSISGTIFLAAAISTNTISGFTDQRIIVNRGAANSQYGMSSASAAYGTNAGSVVTAAVDTTAATTLVITGQKASSGEALTLDAYCVELLLP